MATAEEVPMIEQERNQQPSATAEEEEEPQPQRLDVEGAEPLPEGIDTAGETGPSGNAGRDRE
jgi:hypothetical protein